MTEATKERNGKFVKGSHWIARNGHRWEIMCVNEPYAPEYPISAMRVEGDTGYIRGFTVEGKCCMGPDGDLIAEVPHEQRN